MLKRFSAFLLCLLMLVSSVLLVSCSTDDEKDKSSDVSAATDGFLNEAKNWEGTVVNILGYNGEYSYHSVQIDTEAATGEPVNDAFYARNAFIEEKYGIDVDVIMPTAEEWPINMIVEDIASGLNQYDAVVCPIIYVAPLAVDGSFTDFNSVENGYLHLDQAWWDQTLIRDISINDKVYFLAGDALVEDDESTWAIYFNKDLVNKYSIEDPYTIVRQGKWTLDKMYELIQKVDKTTGASKTYEAATKVDGDQWGMLAQAYDFYLFMEGCEQRMVDNTGDIPVLRVDAEENVATFQKVADILLDEQNVGVADHHGSWLDGIYQTEIQIFAVGNALFMPGAIANVGQATLREAQIHYGILPMPKRSEIQKDYSTSVTVYHCSVMCIPKTNVEKLDVTCYALEAMAFYGKELVTPEYYDRTLTLKRFEDEDSRDMLDLIFRNRTYDLAGVFNFHAGDGNGTLGFYTDLLGFKSKDIMSSYEAKESVFQTGIDDLIERCYND